MFQSLQWVSELHNVTQDSFGFEKYNRMNKDTKNPNWMQSENKTGQEGRAWPTRAALEESRFLTCTECNWAWIESKSRVDL